jgi:tryptophan synthase alpha chain
MRTRWSTWVTTFADRAAAAGVDALLTVDIPPEEVSRAQHELRRVGMDNIFPHRPHHAAERMDLIAAEASGFIYYVSLKGVTGAGQSRPGGGRAQVEEIRRHTALPVCVGFGIKDGPSAAAVAAVADGVVIGSALVQRSPMWRRGGVSARQCARGEDAARGDPRARGCAAGRVPALSTVCDAYNRALTSPVNRIMTGYA